MLDSSVPFTFAPKRHIPLIMASIMLGFLLSVSFYTKSRVQTITPRSTELIDVVNNLQKDRERLQGTIRSLRKEASAFERNVALSEGMLKDFTVKETYFKRAAGLTSVEAPGVKIILADTASMPPNSDPNDYIVHNTDIQAVVNALWRGGASAISVNGERLVGVSAIRCAGNTILINSNLVGSPYEILAAGDPVKLTETVSADKASNIFFDKGLKGNLGIQVIISEDAELKIPAYNGGLGIEFANIKAEKDKGIK